MYAVKLRVRVASQKMGQGVEDYRKGSGAMKRFIRYACLVIILALGISGLVVGCAITNTLADSKWKLIGWSASSLSPEVSNITLQFDAKTASGSSGVNSYGGPYHVKSGGVLIFGNIASTMMASADPDLNRAETIYFELLKSARMFTLENDKFTLTLKDANKNEILIFERVLP